jgi:HSP20 family protein
LSTPEVAASDVATAVDTQPNDAEGGIRQLKEDSMVNTRGLSTTLDRMLSLNRALDQAFAAPMNGNGSRLWVPPMDVAERTDAYLIHAELPGVQPDHVELSFEQNVLTIRGTKPTGLEASQQGELRVYSNERVSGSFERSLRFPDFVDADGIEAHFENGLLTIVIPKAQAAQPRRIQIRPTDNRQLTTDN